MFSGCQTSSRINQTKAAFADRCNGVSSLNWQSQVQGADAEATAKLVAELTAAAEADARRSADLQLAGEANLDIKSEWARVINQNTSQSSEVSEEFWEQENRFTQSLCLYLYLLDSKELSKSEKSDVVSDIRKIVSAYNEIQLNKTRYQNNLSEFQKIKVKLKSPANGSSFDTFPRVLNLNWESVPGAVSYVVEIQLKDYRTGGWYPVPNELGNFVTKENFGTTEFIGAQPGRWRVYAINTGGEESTASDWYTFFFSK